MFPILYFDDLLFDFVQVPFEEQNLTLICIKRTGYVTENWSYQSVCASLRIVDEL